MNILLFKTNIKRKGQIKDLKNVLDIHPNVTSWSVDTLDIDNVLRIVADAILKEEDVIDMISDLGYSCEILTDELYESDS